MIEDRFLTVSELALLLKVPEATVRKWRHRGEGPLGIRIGRHVRFDVDEVERWLNDRTTASRFDRA